MDRKRLRAALPRRPQGLQAGCAADVTDEPEWGHGRGHRGAGASNRAVWDAEKRHLGPPAGVEGAVAPGQLDLEARPLGGRGDRAPRPPCANHREGRQGALVHGLGDVGEIPFQFPHPEIPDGFGRANRPAWPWSAPSGVAATTNYMNRIGPRSRRPKAQPRCQRQPNSALDGWKWNSA